MGFVKSIRKLLKIAVLLELLIILALNVRLDSISSQESANNQTSLAASRKIPMEFVLTVHQVIPLIT